MIETAISWALPESAGYRREPGRPKHLRPPGFSELFDDRVVFYDCFRISPKQVLLIGPPLVRFPGILDSLKISGFPGTVACSFRVEHLFTPSLSNGKTHNLCRIIVDLAEDFTALQLECAAGSAILPVAVSSQKLFRARRVLLTLSKNNHPAWICDWMRFHRDLHDADAVLLYDNGSTAYTTADLIGAMSQVSGFSMVTVVDWPYKYGPQGIGRGTWDSAFCQDGALEDARWRFLGQASAVLSCDIDELTLSPKGSIFDRVVECSTGYQRFAGRWVSPPPQAGGDGRLDAANELPRHRDSTWQVLPNWQWKDWRPRDRHLSPPKWAVVPALCPHDAHWSVHEIVGMKSRVEHPAVACYRHFQTISTHWKKTRASIDHTAGKGLRDDAMLQEAFTRVRWSA